MVDNFVALLASYTTGAVVAEWLYPVAMGYFIAAVPGLIRAVTKWR